MASSSTSSNRSTPVALISASLAGLLLEQRLLLVAQAAGLLEALGLDGVLLLLLHLGDAVLELLEVGRRLHALDAQAGAGLVDEVDGLVGQVAVGDVAVGQVGRGHERLVGDRDPVVGLVAVAQALQDLDGVGDRGLLDLDRLEAALEGGVLLEVLAVLVERGGADGLQLAAGQHRLEDRRGVDGALGRTGTDEGVDLVDEQDDVAAGPDLLEHLLEALLEVAAVAASRPRARRGRACRAACRAASRGRRWLTIFWARPSTMAVLPTPGSPMSTGLFLVRRDEHLHDPLESRGRGR